MRGDGLPVALAMHCYNWIRGTVGAPPLARLTRSLPRPQSCSGSRLLPGR